MAQTSVQLMTLKQCVEDSRFRDESVLVPFGLRLFYVTHVSDDKTSNPLGLCYSVSISNGSNRENAQVANKRLYLPETTGVYIVPHYMVRHLNELRILRNNRYSSDLLIRENGQFNVGDNLYSIDGLLYGTIIDISNLHEGDDLGETWVLTQNITGWHVPLTFGRTTPIMNDINLPFSVQNRRPETQPVVQTEVQKEN